MAYEIIVNTKAVDDFVFNKIASYILLALKGKSGLFSISKATMLVTNWTQLL